MAIESSDGLRTNKTRLAPRLGCGVTARPDANKGNPTTSPVVVAGSGLAGLTAALHLLERGIPVVLLEADLRFFGGRTSAKASMRFELGGTPHELSVDHGQHCVWTQYHNMRSLLAHQGLLGHLVPCQGAQYVVDDGDRVHRLPMLDVNPLRPHPTLAHVLWHLFGATRWPTMGLLDYARLVRALPRLASVFAFEHGRDFAAWDRLSIAEFFDWCGVPESTKTVSHALQKASTFQSAYEMSAAWGLSMLESTMLGAPSDHKMWCFRGNLGSRLIDPLVARLRALGGTVLRNATAAGVVIRQDRVVSVRAEPTDKTADPIPDRLVSPTEIACSAVVSAVDIPGFRQFLLRDLGSHEELRRAARLEAVPSVVVRLVARRRIGASGPWMGILAGPRFRVLDDYFLLSRYQDEFVAWAARTGGEVIELHSYLGAAELDPRKVDSAAVRTVIEREILLAWPELAGQIAHLHVHANPATFDKQAVGHGAFQPRARTAVANLILCGSWIRLDRAIHDMEKAVTTGLEAANAVLEERLLAPFQVLGLRPPGSWQKLARTIQPLLPKPRAVRRAMRASAGPR
jgi:isorenieratene synthase